MTHTAQIILDNVVLVKVEANIYGARKKLKKEDLMLADGTKLPPEDLASLGSKRLLDPDKLSVFNRLKKEAERICLRIGTRFLGGYAIPCESAPLVITELERIALEFAAAKADFLAGYDAAVKDWVVRHPEFADILEKAVDSVEFVATRLSFDYLMVSIGLPEALPEKDIARLESKVSSLSGQMFYEIAVDANQFIEQSLLGKAQVTRHALRPIKRMRDKLDGLGFLDYRVAPVVSTLDALLNRIPGKGAIDGSLLQEIFATALLLADPDKTRRHGEGLLATQSLPMTSAGVDDELQNTGAEESVLNQTQDPAQDQTEAQIPTPFSDLFAGILDDPLDWEAESVTPVNSANPVNETVDSLTLAGPTVMQSPSADSDLSLDTPELETVTTEEDDDNYASASKPDYWF